MEYVLFCVGALYIFSLLYSITLCDYNLSYFFSILLLTGSSWVDHVWTSCLQFEAGTRIGAVTILGYDAPWCSESHPVACDPRRAVARSWDMFIASYDRRCETVFLGVQWPGRGTCT